MGRVFYEASNNHRQKIGRMFGPSLHAEVHSLVKWSRQASKRPKKHHGQMTIYIARITEMTGKNGQRIFGNCSPCQNCQKWLKHYNVTRVRYTDNINGENVLCELKLL